MNGVLFLFACFLPGKAAMGPIGKAVVDITIVVSQIGECGCIELDFCGHFDDISFMCRFLLCIFNIYL